MRKHFLIAIFASLAFNLALPQDAMKAEPTHYKLAFENHQVEVVYIHYGPHEKSKMHSHPQGVVVNVTAAHLRFTDHAGKIQELFAKAGEARWFPPFRHTVENLGDTVYNGVYVGIKGGPSAASGQGPAPQPQLQPDDQTAKILATYLLDARSAQPPVPPQQP